MHYFDPDSMSYFSYDPDYDGLRVPDDPDEDESTAGDPGFPGAENPDFPAADEPWEEPFEGYLWDCQVTEDPEDEWTELVPAGDEPIELRFNYYNPAEEVPLVEDPEHVEETPYDRDRKRILAEIDDDQQRLLPGRGLVLPHEPMPTNAAEIAAALGRRVHGQMHALSELAKLVFIAQLGVTLNPRKPRVVTMLAGPTGVGKTETALALAELLTGDENNLIRLDMSEYQHESSWSRIVGPHPGYSGSSEPDGWLTTRIQKTPRTVLLLDEFEKAAENLQTLFLQMFADGRLTDSRGVTVDCSGLVILLTSNVGAATSSSRNMKGLVIDSQQDSAADALAARPDPFTGADDARALIRDHVDQAIREQFTPEFIGRLDKLIVFDQLTSVGVAEIVYTKLHSLRKQFADTGRYLDIDPEAIGVLAARAYFPGEGARWVDKLLMEEVVEPVGEMPCGTLHLTAGEDKVDIELIHAAPEPEPGETTSFWDGFGQPAPPDPTNRWRRTRSRRLPNAGSTDDYEPPF